MLVSAQTYAGQRDNNTSGQTMPIHLYNPQANPETDPPNHPQKRHKPASNTKASQARPADKSRSAFDPDRFLKHPGRIHYKGEHQSRPGPDDSGQDKTERARNQRKQHVIPSRKPADVTTTPKTAYIKPPEKPAHESAADVSQPSETRDEKNDPSPAYKSASTEESAQMPAVPPGKVEKDKLKGYSLPMPSDKGEDNQDSNVAAKNRLMDRALRRLMIRPDTAELLASIEEVQPTGNGQAAPDRKADNKYFVAASGGQQADYRLVFEKGMRTLNARMRDSLRKHVLDRMQNTSNARLIIKSYATAADTGQSSDRRIALARALKLRKFLIGHNLASDRMNIRALGDASDKPPRDRIDLQISSP